MVEYVKCAESQAFPVQMFPFPGPYRTAALRGVPGGGKKGAAHSET